MAAGGMAAEVEQALVHLWVMHLVLLSALIVLCCWLSALDRRLRRIERSRPWPIGRRRSVIQ